MTESCIKEIEQFLGDINAGAFQDYTAGQWEELTKRILKSAIDGEVLSSTDSKSSSSKLTKKVTSLLIDRELIRMDSIVEIKEGKDTEPVRGVVTFINNHSIKILIEGTRQVSYTSHFLASDKVEIEVINY